MTVSRSESLRPGLIHHGDGWEVARWLDHVEGEMEPELVAQDGVVACWRKDTLRYLATWPEGAVLHEVIARAVADAGLHQIDLVDGLRIRRTSKYCFVFNYAAEAREVPPEIEGEPILGSRALDPSSYAVFAAV